MLSRAAVLVCGALAVIGTAGNAAQRGGAPDAAARGSWPQWGGPDRNFTSPSTGLAASWLEQGPRRLWSRALGQGHSAISSDGSHLFTIYRPVTGRVDEEVVAALDAATGRTVWEHWFASPMAGAQFGPYIGPHTTPLITSDRVFAAGSRKQLFALDKATGKVIWSRNLIKEYGAPEGDRGYAASPLLFQDLLIVSVGGPGQALAAFNAATGALVWKSGHYLPSPASPILIDLDGQAQVVYLAGNMVAGFDPSTGRALWWHPHQTSASLNISTPLWSPAERLLFVSAGYGTGSRGLELRRTGQTTTVAERWSNNRIRVHFGNAVRAGQFVLGSSGDFGPMFLSAVDPRTGDIVWQDRTFARAQLVVADGKVLILDEEGHLALGVVSAKGVQILARAKILEPMAWTPPTLVGTRLFVRDRKSIGAYELGK